MRLLLVVFALAPLLAAAQRPLPSERGRMRKIPFAKCADGAETTLWTGGELPKEPMHDGPEGSATFEVHASSGVRGRITLPGRGLCLGYVRELGAYVIASEHEIGAIVPVAALMLLDDKGKARGTAFGDDGFWAYAIATSGSHRRVAFVGESHGRPGTALYVLDLVDETIRKLGPAPAPPPSPGGPPRKGPWRWGIDGMDGYRDLEPAVMAFEGETLRVSYGADTMRARSKRRTEKRWALDAPSGATTQPAPKREPPANP